MCTACKGEVKLDNIIGSLVKVEDIGTDVGVLSCLVKVLLHHV